jgi:murein DD-endopeptidase MepM/ murein hydrolase activator NlpD
VAVIAVPSFGYANSINSLERTIEEKQQEIEKLEMEISKYKSQISKTQSQSQTYSDLVKRTEAERAKLLTEIQMNIDQLSVTSYQLSEIEKKILTIEDTIERNEESIRKSLRSIHELDSSTFFERVFSSASLGELMKNRDMTGFFVGSLENRVNQLEIFRQDLLKERERSNSKKNDLEELRNIIEARKVAIETQKREHETLLSESKRKEKTYKQVLAEKMKLQKEFEKELFEYESQLSFLKDPTKLPARGSGVLSWPLDDIFVTQRFGKTSASGRLYASGTHSGVDFRANNDPVYAMANGVVVGTGDTDLACRGASFGKWILIRYDNNLSSTYGHLSQISVKAGQRVKRGEFVGLSGATGHVTGPHLHVSLYADIDANNKRVVRIEGKESLSCKGKILVQPRAPTTAYLDALDYIPNLTPADYKEQLR